MLAGFPGAQFQDGVSQFLGGPGAGRHVFLDGDHPVLAIQKDGINGKSHAETVDGGTGL